MDKLRAREHGVSIDFFQVPWAETEDLGPMGGRVEARLRC